MFEEDKTYFPNPMILTMISYCLFAHGQAIQKDPKPRRRELLLQFSSLNTSHSYKSGGCEVLSCQIPLAVRCFKMTSHAGLFWKVNTTFSTAELPLIGLLGNKTHMAADSHDYHAREYKGCRKRQCYFRKRKPIKIMEC